MFDEDMKRRVKELCDQIAREQDHKRFSSLISELNHLLETSSTKSNHDGARPASVASEKPS